MSSEQGGEQPRFFSGRRVYDPVRAAQVAASNQYVRDSIYDFVDGLPLGETGEAPDVLQYAQPDRLTCFYASLSGIATALHDKIIDVPSVGARARAEGLLDEYGAVTFTESQETQKDFIHREMGVDIRFINTLLDPDRERINALTHGLATGKHVVFGLTRHWVALDGISKFGRGRDQATWTGMNPSGGRRIESDARRHITPRVVADRLIAGDLPVVVVEGTPRRFTGRVVPQAAGRRQIRRADTRLTPGRRIRRVE